MERIQLHDLVLIAKGKRLDASVRYNPFGNRSRNEQRAALRQHLDAREARRQEEMKGEKYLRSVAAKRA